MDKIAHAISEAMENSTAFTIPLFGGIPVSQSCVVTWIIMAALVALSIVFTRNLKLVPGRKQMMIEAFVGFLRNFFRDQLGEKGMCYFPFLCTVIIYIGFSNIIGLFGFTPPTKDLNVTAALAIMSIILVEVAGIRAKGTKGWLKSFAKPVAIIAPLNVMEIAIRPLSLCMRLFGNVLASVIIMELLKAVVPIFVPLVFSAYFDIFDGFIQAYVFVFLTSLYIDEAIEDED
ncbi:F0F1 ATP synthase subunit A [Ruminococcus sp. Marseille-P6503]|uniref:F0F1 ATP synthase subunit A n=1 Tax=Ruminococcus sp. Marseille-P6503 TaxID=2364796 RepID=UPI000F527AEF|nr:F0F1 ATP synthase subunit A [Ruminococcus sp. Marseille-P6503]